MSKAETALQPAVECLPCKTFLALCAFVVLGLLVAASLSSRSGDTHSLSLDTPYGRFGFQEYDWGWHRASPKPSTFEDFRKRTREAFIARQLQPKSRYTTFVFFGSHKFKIDRSLSSVLLISCGGLCLVALLSAVIVTGCHVQSKTEIDPA